MNLTNEQTEIKPPQTVAEAESLVGIASTALFGFRCRWIGRYSKSEKLLRLIRCVWCRGKGPGIGGRGNYSAKLSIAIEFKLADFWVGAFWKTKRDESWLWICVIPCVPLRVHYQRSHGGRHV